MSDLVTYQYNPVTHLVFTSVDDLQSSLRSFDAKDLKALEEAFEIARERGMKTKSLLLGRRIRQLKKMENLKNV